MLTSVYYIKYVYLKVRYTF